MCISMNLEVLGENWEGNKRGHLEKKKKEIQLGMEEYACRENDIAKNEAS